ncbi:MAG: hypothetical protein AAF908_02450, partial [Pseudomonadota bacterium]
RRSPDLPGRARHAEGPLMAILARVLGVGLAVALAALVYYLSRFWEWRLWPREGLFGVEGIDPRGGLGGRWLRGTDLAVFDLIVWAVGVFLVLSIVEWLVSKLRKT